MKKGIQAIIRKIQADAEQHSTERYTQIKENIDKEIKNENEFYLDDHNKRKDILKNHNELEYSRLLERLSSRLNREILTYQHSLIDEIFDMAVIKLREASEQEFSEMFKAAVKDLQGNFVALLGEFSKNKLNIDAIKEVTNDGLRIFLSDEIVPGKSGFILRDDRVEYNCLFENLIDDKKNDQSAAVLKEVFES